MVGIALHRKVLKTVFTKILSVWTKGETEKRLAEEPKDKLFHISMVQNQKVPAHNWEKLQLLGLENLLLATKLALEINILLGFRYQTTG